MQREIKFRAWDGKQFVSQFKYSCIGLTLDGDAVEMYNEGSHYGWDYKDNLILSQFTGLHDKNGKGVEVYEGDYFEAIYKDCPDGYSILGKETTVIKIRATVVFKFGQFAVEMMHPEYKQIVHTNLFDFLKNEQKIVIGNIYENPELTP